MSVLEEAAEGVVIELWNDAERAAFLPPERISLPDWSEKYRVLSPRQSPTMPGPWRNHNNPAVVGFMVVLEKPGVRQVTVLKHSQGGYSEAVRNYLAKKAHLEPCPALIVLPDDKVGKKIVQTRIVPLFEDTEVLRDLATGKRHDKKSNSILLSNGFSLTLGYSGSISSVSSDPQKIAICDERSKFQKDGKTSIAGSIRARTSRFEDSLIINISTPLTDPDPTQELFDLASIKLYFWINCPACQNAQRLTFDSLSWEPKKATEPDKVKRAELIRANRSAWIVCENPKCQAKMPCTRQHELVRKGFWAPQDFAWKCFCDGREVGVFPTGTTVGLFAPAFTSLAPGHRWSEIAARWCEAEGDHEQLIAIHNELFAEVYRPTTSVAVTGTFERKCVPNPETGFVPGKANLLPKWAARLLMAVDTQKDYFYWVIRAYGYGRKSRRIAHGKAMSFDDLAILADQSWWPYEEYDKPANENRLPPLRVFKTAIDSGGGKMGLDASRTDEVYRWCNLDRMRRLPFKGTKPREGGPIRTSRIQSPTLAGKHTAYEVMLWLIDVLHWQDVLASDIEATTSKVDDQTGELVGTEDLWQLNDFNDDDYNRQLSNFKRVLIKKETRWVEKNAGARVDYRHLEGYLEALAAGPGQCLALDTYEQMIASMRTPVVKPGGGVRMPDGSAFLVTQRR